MQNDKTIFVRILKNISDDLNKKHNQRVQFQANPLMQLLDIPCSNVPDNFTNTFVLNIPDYTGLHFKTFFKSKGEKFIILIAFFLLNTNMKTIFASPPRFPEILCQRSKNHSK